MAEPLSEPLSAILTLLENLDWTPQQTADFEAAINRSKLEANVVVAGITGAGKSSLINALCGAVPKDAYDPDDIKRPARVGTSLDSEPMNLKDGYVAQSTTWEGEDGETRTYTIRVWDSQGLEDGTGLEGSYLRRLKESCKDQIDVLLYCIDVSKAKAIAADIVRGMKLITEELGSDVWKHSIVVLTFANTLAENIKEEVGGNGDEESTHEIRRVFLSRIDNWQNKVRQALVEAGVPDEIAHGIPIEPAGCDTSPHLPDRIHWLGYLWLLFVCYAQDEARFAILLNNQHRIYNAQFLTPCAIEDLLENSSTPPIIIDDASLGSKYVPLSAGVAASIAGATGSAIGATIGGLLLGVATAGIGAAVGVAAGSVTGYTVGLLCSVAFIKVYQEKKERKKRQTAAEANRPV